MDLRSSLIGELLQKASCLQTSSTSQHGIAAHFGHLTFHRGVMERMLSKEVAKGIFTAMEGREKLSPSHADAMATSLKDWAINLGATHFCHWFQPLTGCSAEKQDAFLDFSPKGMPVEKLSGKQLLRGEPDASSFPSGGLRKTSAARGYTCWDPQSPPFIWKSGGSSILYIPSVFFSWSGEALDMKIPLIRSEEKLSQAAIRLLRLLEVEASLAYATLGCEQEFFIIDRKLFSLRPDLLLSGRSVFGSPSAKSQELGSHYFSTMPERVLSFLKEVEEAAMQIGIPLKTRHSEVAPHQYEIAPIFERASQSIDHNLLLMQLMEQTSVRHGLACLFHEKPFAGINGSGKHCNWSIATDSGLNLLDPSLLLEKPLVFLSFLAAVVSAVYQYAPLLRASIASAGNDHRLGGHEAPPALISVYLGLELEKLVQAVEEGREYVYSSEGKYNIKISSLPDLMLDMTDRNRTSPFVFTGNKFEFRSVGSSAHCAQPMMTLNAMVAASLHQMIREIEMKVGQSIPVKQAAMQVIQERFIQSRSVRYLGDNYTKEWLEEAQSRHLPHLEKSAHAFDRLVSQEADLVFEGILSGEERKARMHVLEDRYRKTLELEARLMIELFATKILPSCLAYQKLLAESVSSLHSMQGAMVQRFQELFLQFNKRLDHALCQEEALKNKLTEVVSLEEKDQTALFCHAVYDLMQEFRKAVDSLEVLTQDSLWPLPKYRELLFLL